VDDEGHVLTVEFDDDDEEVLLMELAN